VTITVKDAANIINYLYAAQAITVTDNQHAVWADYINAEMPELLPRDIPVSARLAIKQWSQHGRAWKIDVQKFVDAARKIRADRIAIVGTNVPLPFGLPAGKHQAYKAAVYRALGDGHPLSTAEATARREVDHQDDDVKLVGPPPTLEKFITKIKETAE